MKYNFMLLAFFLLGCSSNKKQQTSTTETENISVVNLSENVLEVSSLPLNEAVSKVNIVSLEVTDESFMGDIDKLQVTDDDIWIKHYKDERIVRFSRSGKYLNKVGIIGQGPQEYIRADDFFIDEKLNEIYIVTTTCGVKVYDFEGTFKRIATKRLAETIFNTVYTQYLFFNNKFFIAQNIALYNIPIPKDSLWSFALVDSTYNKKKIFKNPAHIGREEQIIENGVDFTKFVNYWTESKTNIDTYDNQLTLKYPDTDTIYQYDNTLEDLLPQYSIYANEEKGDYATTHLLYSERKALDYFAIRHYYPSKEFIYLVGTKGDKIYTYCYNRLNGSVRVHVKQGKIIERSGILPAYRIRSKFVLSNDLCGGNFTIDYRSSGKYWIDVLEPGSEENWIDIDEVKTSTVKDETSKTEFIKTLENVNEDSNPILVIATLK